MASNPNILNDLGTLLGVPNKVLAELSSKAGLCIGSAINDALMAQEEALVVNIGIGNLSINLITMQCKFVPSRELKAVIKKAISTKVDPLELVISDAATEKLIAICNGVL